MYTTRNNASSASVIWDVVLFRQENTDRPCLFSSLIALLGQNLSPDGNVPLQQAAWYRKQKVTFRDVFLAVRQHLWGDFSSSTSPQNADVILLPRSDFARLAYAACSSA